VAVGWRLRRIRRGRRSPLRKLRGDSALAPEPARVPEAADAWRESRPAALADGVRPSSTPRKRGWPSCAKAPVSSAVMPAASSSTPASVDREIGRSASTGRIAPRARRQGRPTGRNG
jgi:hypothetical protein